MRPIFNRAPLTPNTVAPLPTGAVRAEGWLEAQLKLQALAMPADADLEARVALAWALNDEPMKADCAARVKALTEDAAFTACEGSLTGGIRALSAIRRYFTATGERELLGVMDRYFKKLFYRLDTVPMKDGEVARGADMMELALWLYDITGQKYLPELCWKIRRQTLDWPDILHTFPMKNAMGRAVPNARMEEGLRDEEREGQRLEGENRPYFAKLSRITEGAELAAGLRAPGIFNMIKSGFKEKEGFANGWSRLTEAHGVANGMYTCDTKLNGRNPNQGVDLAAIAEMMTTLETLIGLGEINAIGELCETLEKIAYNALPAAFSSDMKRAQRVQQVNQVAVTKAPRPWYSLGEDASLFREGNTIGWDAWPKFAAAQWYATDDGGVIAASYAPCSVRAALGGVAARLRVSGGYPFTSAVRVEVSVKQPAEFPIYLRVPSWARKPMIYTPEGEILSVRAGEVTCIRRKWVTGDVLRLDLPAEPKLSRWYVQSASVELGPLVMACQPEEEWEEGGVVRTSAPWSWALMPEEPMKAVYAEDRVVPFGMRDTAGTGVQVKAVRIAWNSRADEDGYTAGNADTVPRNEKPIGEPCVLRLVPYGDTALRVAQFPTVNE